MYCSDCGHENADTAKFCSACGVQLPAQKLTAQDAVKEESAQEEKQKEISIPSYSIPKLIPKSILSDDEKIVFEARPAAACALFVSQFLGWFFMALAIVMFVADSPGGGKFFIILAILVMLSSFIKWRYTIYYETSLDRIQDIRLKMSASQRMFGCGDITITKAGTGQADCILGNIKNPAKVQKTLRTLT